MLTPCGPRNAFISIYFVEILFSIKVINKREMNKSFNVIFESDEKIPHDVQGCVSVANANFKMTIAFR